MVCSKSDLLGRVDDALDQSRNLVSLPRHPQYNSMEKQGSFKYGRQRLLQVLSEYALWDELIREAGGHYLPPTDDEAAQEEWLGWLAVAQFMTGDSDERARTLRSLQRRRLALQTQLLDLREANSASDDDDDNAGRESTDSTESDVEDSADEVATESPSPEEIKKQLEATAPRHCTRRRRRRGPRKDLKTLRRHLEVADLESVIKAKWLADAGDLDEAIKITEKAVKDDQSQVRPLATLVDLLWHRIAKRKHWNDSTNYEPSPRAPTSKPRCWRNLLQSRRWAGRGGVGVRSSKGPSDDLGDRPPLDELGPFRWRPYTAPSWSARTASDDLVSGKDADGRPENSDLLSRLWLSTLHRAIAHVCTDAQRLSRSWNPTWWQSATETVNELQLGIKNFDEKLEIPLLSDGEKHVFKSFRCWDDFENQPLHGTFLLDAKGQVRWQDISYEPFSEPEFLLKGAKRLLELP